jgi:hypothetical protein
MTFRFFWNFTQLFPLFLVGAYGLHIEALQFVCLVFFFLVLTCLTLMRQTWNGQVENQIIDVLLELLRTAQSDRMRVSTETPWYYC